MEKEGEKQEITCVCNILKIKDSIYQMSYRNNYTCGFPKSTIIKQMKLLEYWNKRLCSKFLNTRNDCFNHSEPDPMASIKIKDAHSQSSSEVKYSLYKVLAETMSLLQRKKQTQTGYLPY